VPTAAEAFTVSPFARLARTHALVIAGDAMVALALADSLFFTIDPDAARTKVGLYLALTMAPFALVAPLIGPALDRARGGRRWMIVGSSVLRMLLAVVMIDDINKLILFPEAFMMLVLAKGYQVAKSAMVPVVVDTESELVRANSRLSLITGLAGFAAGIPGVIMLQLGGSEWVIAYAALLFSLSALVGLRLPNERIAAEPADEVEKAELHGTGIVLASSAMALLRGTVGFFAFLLAFDLRSEPTWQLGLVLVTSVGGSAVASLVAPTVRRTTREEDMLAGALGITMLIALLTAWNGGLLSAVLLSFTLGFCANAGKVAFDTIVQRDAPDANRGRSFARFETRFQLAWVIGAFIPVLIPIPAQIGFLVIALVTGFAGISYLMGQRSRRRHPRGTPIADSDA